MFTAIAAILTRILWIVFFLNLIRFLGVMGIGNFLYNSKIIFLHALMNPDGTSRFVSDAAKTALASAGYAFMAGIVLYHIYF